MTGRTKTLKHTLAELRSFGLDSDFFASASVDVALDSEGVLHRPYRTCTPRWKASREQWGRIQSRTLAELDRLGFAGDTAVPGADGAAGEQLCVACFSGADLRRWVGTQRRALDTPLAMGRMVDRVDRAVAQGAVTLDSVRLLTQARALLAKGDGPDSLTEALLASSRRLAETLTDLDAPLRRRLADQVAVRMVDGVQRRADVPPVEFDRAACFVAIPDGSYRFHKREGLGNTVLTTFCVPRDKSGLLLVVPRFVADYLLQRADPQYTPRLFSTASAGCGQAGEKPDPVLVETVAALWDPTDPGLSSISTAVAAGRAVLGNAGT